MTSQKNNSLTVKKFVVGALGTNCYLIYESDSRNGILIDPGTDAPEITEYIKDNNIDMVCTINTHGHADHIMGNAAFGFPVFIHELDESCLRDPRRSLAIFQDKNAEPVHAERTLADGDIIELGTLKLEVIHTPGHTPGSISIRHENLLFSGDCLFFEGVGRTDLPEGDETVQMEAIEKKLFVLPDDVKVFPGHGPETTIGHERRNNPFL